MKYVDLYDVLTDAKMDYSRDGYAASEDAIQPKLQEAGYALRGRWYTVEGDSFGPLIRGVRVTRPDGEEATITYG